MIQSYSRVCPVIGLPLGSLEAGSDASPQSSEAACDRPRAWRRFPYNRRLASGSTTPTNRPPGDG